MPTKENKPFFKSFNSKIREIFSLDLRSIAAFRVSLGLLIVLDLISRTQDLTAFYTDQGVLPRWAIWGDTLRYGFSLHLMNGTWAFQAFLFLLAFIFAIFLIVGYRTHLSAFVSWVMLISIQNRNPFLGSGGDQLFAVILFWSLFLPLGAKYSIDSLKIKNNLPKFVSNAATTAFILQIFFLYFFTVLLKKGALWRSEGTAVFYALNQTEFSTPIGAFLLNFPELLKISTFGVFAFEALGPLFLIFPFKTMLIRTVAVFLFIFMHTMFGFGLNLGIFSFVVVTAFIALIPGLFWEKLHKLLINKQRVGLKIYYDFECSFCAMLSQGIKTFFLLPETQVLSAQENPKVLKEMNKNDSWVVKDYKDQSYYRFKAFIPIFKASPILFIFTPLLYLKIVQRAGEVIYKFISKRRKEIFCELPKSVQKKDVSNLVLNKYTQGAIFGLIIFVFYWNLSYFKSLNYLMIPPFREAGYFLRLNQNWNLFAPNPSLVNKWYVFTGETLSGEKYDVLKKEKSISFEKLPFGEIPYKNTRWVKFYSSLTLRSNKNFNSYANYLCSSFEKDKIVKIEANRLSYKIDPNGSDNPLVKKTLRFNCQNT